MKKKMMKISGMAYCVFWFSMMFQMVSFAYLDPSVMTYAIQAIAGVAIAIGAAVGIYWRRARRKLNEKLGVDEKKNKEVEEDVVEIKETK